MCQHRTSHCNYCNHTKSKWSKCAVYWDEHTRHALASSEGIVPKPEDCPELSSAGSGSGSASSDEAVTTIALGDCPRLHYGCPSLEVLAGLQRSEFEVILQRMEDERDEAFRNLDEATKGGVPMEQQRRQQPREMGAPIQANLDIRRRMDEEWKRAREREAIQKRGQREEISESLSQSGDHVSRHDGSETSSPAEDGLTPPTTPEDQGMLGVLGSWITKTIVPITKATRSLLVPFRQQQSKVRDDPITPAPTSWEPTVDELTPWGTTADDSHGYALPMYDNDDDGRQLPPQYQPADRSELAVSGLQPPPPVHFAYAETELVHPRRPVMAAARMVDVIGGFERGIHEQEMQQRQERRKHNYLSGMETVAPSVVVAKPSSALQRQDVPIQPSPGLEGWAGTLSRRKNHRQQGWEHDGLVDAWVVGQSSRYYWGPGDSGPPMAQSALKERQPGGHWNPPVVGYYTGHNAYCGNKAAQKPNPYGHVGDNRPLSKPNPPPPVAVQKTERSYFDDFAHEDFEPSEPSSGSDDDFYTNYQVSELSWHDSENDAASPGKEQPQHHHIGPDRQTAAPPPSHGYGFGPSVKANSKAVPAAKVVLRDPDVGHHPTSSGKRESWIDTMQSTPFFYPFEPLDKLN